MVYMPVKISHEMESTIFTGVNISLLIILFDFDTYNIHMLLGQKGLYVIAPLKLAC